MEGPMLKLKLYYFGHLMQRANWLEKTLMLGRIEGRRKRGMTEDEMVGPPSLTVPPFPLSWTPGLTPEMYEITDLLCAAL